MSQIHPVRGITHTGSWSSGGLRYGVEYITFRSERRSNCGFVNYVYRYHGSPVQRGAKPNPFTTPNFVEKKFLRQKTRNDENRLAFRPIFRHMGRILEGALIVVIVIQVAREIVVVCFW